MDRIKLARDIYVARFSNRAPINIKDRIKQAFYAADEFIKYAESQDTTYDEFAAEYEYLEALDAHRAELLKKGVPRNKIDDILKK